MNPIRGFLVRLRAAHVNDKLISHGIAWLVLFVILGKIIGAAKEMAIAWQYGISADVDAYLFVFNLLTWPATVWFSVLSVVLIPLAAHMRLHNPSGVSRFRAELLAATLLIGAGFVLLCWFGLPALVRSSWSGLPSETAGAAIAIIPTMLPIAILAFVISLFSVWVMAGGRQTNTLFESIPALVLLWLVLALPAGGMAVLAWGTLLGMLLHALALALAQGSRGEFERPCFRQTSDQWPAFLRHMSVMLIGSLLMNAITLVDQFLAARLGSGAIATLNYSNRLLALVLGLGGTVVARATLPVFADMRSRSDASLAALSLRWAGLFGLFGIVALVIGWWLAPWAVSLVYERGAFTRDDAQSVASVLRAGLTQLPVYFSGIVLVSVLAARRSYFLLTCIGAASLAAKLAVSFWLIPLIGLNGLMYSTSMSLTVSLVLIVAILQTTKRRDLLS